MIIRTTADRQQKTVIQQESQWTGKKTSVTRIGSGSRNRGPSNGQTAGAEQDPQKNNDKAGKASDHRHGRFSRKNNRSHYDHLNRSIKQKREETVDDIRADIDQLEKISNLKSNKSKD